MLLFVSENINGKKSYNADNIEAFNSAICVKTGNLIDTRDAARYNPVKEDALCYWSSDVLTTDQLEMKFFFLQ